jgi:type IV fimbrial biogenesis protein FimT
MRHLRYPRGLTLIELAVGISIAAFLMMVAAPFFGDYIRNARLREGGNVLLSEALFAQSEAIKRNTTVRLSTDGVTILVVVPNAAGVDEELHRRALSGSVVAPVATLDFGSEGRPVPFGNSGTINLSMTGEICSDDTRCPGLRVDAGGATRLCGNFQHNCI